MNELPSGWISIELENHVYIAGRIGWRGLKRSEYKKEGVMFLAVKNILSDGTIDFRDTDHISWGRYIESPEIQLRPDDILLTKDGTIGKVGMIKSLPKETTVNSSILVVRPNQLILPRFLFYFLRGPQFQSIARERITGSAIPHLFQKDIKKLKALVPPLNEQRRIVEKLETLIGKVDACQKRLERIPLILKRFRQAVLAAACSGKLTTDWRVLNNQKEDWNWERLEDMCKNVVDCPHSTPRWTDLGIICIRTTNFKPNFLDLSEVRYVSEETYQERTQRLVPKTNDLVYSREGGILGIACIIPDNVQVCLGQRMMLMRTKESYLPKLLMFWLNSPEILEIVKDSTGGSASPHLNVRDIKNFRVPLPLPEEQKEIVRRVEELFKYADQIEARYKRGKAYVDKLTQSILAKAFRGELVPQDPTDEPASILLERIQKERKTKPTPNKKARPISTKKKQASLFDEN